MYRLPLLLAVLCLGQMTANAAQTRDGFSTGPLLRDFGPVAEVANHLPVPPDTEFKVSFDVSEQAAPGALNRSLVAGARFLNMHARAGIRAENMKLAFVIHGSAVHDLTQDQIYRSKAGAENANAALIEALLANGVRIILCGQTAAARGVTAADLLPGVEMSLSAMTAHAQLQQGGFTLNPF